MSQSRLRFIGGPLSGRAVWIDDDRPSLSVQVAGLGEGLRQTHEYRREGSMLVFVGPTDVPTDVLIDPNDPTDPKEGG